MPSDGLRTVRRSTAAAFPIGVSSKLAQRSGQRRAHWPRHFTQGLLNRVIGMNLTGRRLVRPDLKNPAYRRQLTASASSPSFSFGASC